MTAKSIPVHRIPRALTSLQVMRKPYETYAKWRAKHGDTYMVRAVNGDVVVTCDTDVIRDLFRASSADVEPFGAEAAGSLLGMGSLLLMKGEPHRRERKLLTPPFHGPRMRAYGEIIQGLTRARAAKWRAGEAIIAADAMLDISIEVIVRAVFGVLEDARVHQWSEAVRALIKEISPLALFIPALQRSFFGLGPWPRFLAARDHLDGLIYGEVEARRASGERGEDILSLMLDATYEDEALMSDRGIRDELVTLLFAGHETTQISMSWALYHIHREAGVRATLLEELKGCDGAPETLNRLPYLDALINETLRLGPIVPDLVRTLSKPMTLGSYELAAGTNVSPTACLVHAREDLYPEPDRFRPERFLEGKPRPWEYLPFGGGVRRCIGAALATYEMKVVLGTLLREAAFESNGEDWMVRRNVTMGTRHGVRLRVVRVD